MADVSVKMGVSGVAQFIQGMQQAGASVKTIDAALKQNEKQLKATGDAETYMQQKTALLNGKIAEQKRVINTLEQSLKTLDANGTSKVSKSYQDLQRKLLDAQTAMMDTEEQLRNVGTASVEASGQTDQLAASLGGLNRRVSLEQVTGAIGALTGGLERAGKKAIEVGKLIWENIADSARYADDTATSAMILDMDVERYQAYRNVFATEAELTVQEWVKAKQKVQNAIYDPTDDQDMILKLLGVDTHEMVGTKYARVEGAARNYEEVFWEIGKRLREKVANGEITQDLADTYANALFGKSFANLNPIFAMGEDAFKAAVDSQVTASKEAIENNAKLNDTLIDLQNDFNSLKQEVLSGLTPALTGAAQVLDGLLERLIKYLQSEDGQKALEDMEKAVEGLFSDLSNIDPEKVVENFAKVFSDIVGAFEWVKDHWGDVKTGLFGIAAGFGALKIATLALNIGRAVSGLSGLIGGGAEQAAQAAAAPPIGQAAGQEIGTWMRVGLTSAGQWVGKIASTLAGADPTGSLALAPQLIEDRTTLGHELANGAALIDALAASWETVKASAKQGVDNLTTYFSEQLPNAFWGIFGFASAEDAARQVQDVAEQTKKNMQAADEYTFDDHMSVDEMMALINGDKPAEVYVKPKASITFNEELLAQIGPFVIPANVAIAGIEGISSLGMSSFLYAAGIGRSGGSSSGIVPANFSSNLYVENMTMGNGIDAAGLAQKMAEAQRRISTGFGS